MRKNKYNFYFHKNHVEVNYCPVHSIDKLTKNNSQKNGENEEKLVDVVGGSLEVLQLDLPVLDLDLDDDDEDLDDENGVAEEVKGCVWHAAKLAQTLGKGRIKTVFLNDERKE